MRLHRPRPQMRLRPVRAAWLSHPELQQVLERCLTRKPPSAEDLRALLPRVWWPGCGDAGASEAGMHDAMAAFSATLGKVGSMRAFIILSYQIISVAFGYYALLFIGDLWCIIVSQGGCWAVAEGRGGWWWCGHRRDGAAVRARPLAHTHVPGALARSTPARPPAYTRHTHAHRPHRPPPPHAQVEARQACVLAGLAGRPAPGLDPSGTEDALLTFLRGIVLRNRGATRDVPPPGLSGGGGGPVQQCLAWLNKAPNARHAPTFACCHYRAACWRSLCSRHSF